MSNAVEAVQALINAVGQNNDLVNSLTSLFESSDEFLVKVKQFDELFEQHQDYHNVKEYAFDLLMVYHLEFNNQNEDYFDSREWQDIEDKTLDRGTEFLNILLYISEAKDTDAEVSIEDFLYEFLLVDEDEFQDEHRIYEELIANVELPEESVTSIVEVAKRLPDELEIRELFVPLMLFFKDPEAKFPAKEFISKTTKPEIALLAAALAYANG